MSKGNLFVGSASGKVGNLVLANTKQGQITRAYQPKVSNPKSKAQMLQRAKFATAVKFFKQMTSGFFKFAYEDKAQNESDYNAFMRHNIKNAAPMSRELYEDPKVLAAGEWFQLSSGRLSTQASLKFDTEGSLGVGIYFPKNTSNIDTIGALSAAFISEGASEGDIVTFVVVNSSSYLLINNDTGTVSSDIAAPDISISQFIVDSTNTAKLTDIPCMGTKPYLSATGGNTLIFKTQDHEGYLGGLVITRNTDSGLLATDSYLLGDSVWTKAVETLYSDAQVAKALASWKATEIAILKGSIAEG